MVCALSHSLTPKFRQEIQNPIVQAIKPHTPRKGPSPLCYCFPFLLDPSYSRIFNPPFLKRGWRLTCWPSAELMPDVDLVQPRATKETCQLFLPPSFYITRAFIHATNCNHSSGWYSHATPTFTVFTSPIIPCHKHNRREIKAQPQQGCFQSIALNPLLLDK